jgi:hypothetical protein
VQGQRRLRRRRGTCSACRKFVCSDDHDIDCSSNAECADAGKGTCVCIPGADEDVVANIVDDHEWVSGYSSLYGLDTLLGDPGSPHPSYCSGAWREFSGGQVTAKPDDLTALLDNAMSYYGCAGPYVENGSLGPPSRRTRSLRIHRPVP